jgi:uncharacterized protein (TIGR03437 family)
MPPIPRLAVAALILATACASFAADTPCNSLDPLYTAAGIVNAASNLAEPLATFTWVSLYGCNLSYNTRGRSSEDQLPGFGGVKVLVNNQAALLSYISPTQVNFLMPFSITTPKVTIQLEREGDFGPAVTLALSDCSPELFLVDETTAVAAHADWTVVTKDAPAEAGEIIILYATGLGQFEQKLDDTEVPAKQANPIRRRTEFKVLLDGAAVEDRLVEYAGAAPLFTGVYQINLRLPAAVGPDPEIRIALGERLSTAGVHLPVK